VLTSTLRRARDTCRIAGYDDRALPDADLCEWDYARYEGRTSDQIRLEDPGWIGGNGGQGRRSRGGLGALASHDARAARDPK
jgi:broad specificity phosphatase PhoE